MEINPPNRITYLIGAGASANALPIVDGIPRSMGELGKILDELCLDDNKFYEFDDEETKWDYQRMFQADLEEVKSAISEHASADTYAKKLYLQKDEHGLVRLKLMLSILFTVMQAKPDGLVKPLDISGKPLGGIDNRYDAFFASILDSLVELPPNIRILSWNYDQQFEMSFARFTRRGLEDAHQVLNVQFKHTGNSVHSSDNTDAFSIIKLNGSTGLVGANSTFRSLYSDYRVTAAQNNGIDPKDGFGFNVNLIDYLIGKYHETLLPFNQGKRTLMTPLMSFAWEEEKFEKTHIMTKAVVASQKTDVLVVIGYSFPYFNREIDKMIFDNMRKVRKIYIQDPEPEGIKERIKALMPRGGTPEAQKLLESSFVLMRNLNQFVLPQEL